MRELIYEVGIRPSKNKGSTWEAFAPDLPELMVAGQDEMAAFEAMKEKLPEYISLLLKSGEDVPQSEVLGCHCLSHGIIYWQFVKINLGPRANEVPVLEVVFPELEQILSQSEESLYHECQ